MMRLSLPAAGLLVLAAAQAQAGGYLDRFELPPGAGYVGAETCLECHDDVSEAYLHSPHAISRALAVPGTEVYGCEACHGPGSLHVDEGGDGFILGVASLGGLDDEGRAGMCIQCHTARRLDWNGGPHAGTGVTCADCHAGQVHFGGAAEPAANFRNAAEFCLQCHAAQAGDFRLPFHHRVLEGEVSCADCHDPHAGFAASGWNEMNEVCLGCHAEMAGPFVFEHEGVAAEDCTACHRPHGSMNDKLLATDGGSLCLQCHFEAGFDADADWAIGDMSHDGLLDGEARCYDCHVEIHGSNVSPTFRN
ncbi:DmsE family decaheme c-type cytochrome [bacterium]|nr:DmsE family decaheme c-type cytochrome [bacterium]MBU1072838.1 DmsE family decaheme c-type cytochrome [bacterium]MBU1675761.1 DmsE family decaheme c-type cytochrome [bacterium]